MVNPPKDLQPFKAVIHRLLYEENQTSNDVLQYLSNHHDLVMSKRTLERRLSEWGYTQRQQTDDTPLLRARMKVLFYDVGLDDETMLYILQEEGYSVGLVAMQRLRRTMSMHRRIGHFSQRMKNSILEEIVQMELDKGTITQYGRSRVQEHFRMQGIFVSRYVLETNTRAMG
jgi:Clr5 domain